MKKTNKSPMKPDKSSKADITDQGVTLAQVRALIKPKPAPSRSLRTKTPDAAEENTPDALGVERKKRLLQRRREHRDRIRDYKAMMVIMKKQGVKGLAPAVPVTPTRRAIKATATAPLQILAEGDSWFDYPVPFFGGGIIPRLEDLLGVPILNLAKAGDEVRFMLGVEERKILEKQLREGCPAGGPWDVLLFSGGGNDIVDNPMALWIKDYDASLQPSQLLNQPRFDAALALVQAGYEDLITLRDTLSPSTQLVFHSYDYAIPDGRGICHLGPWLKPTFDLRKFPSNWATAFEVVKEMLTQFATLLAKLQNAHNGVTFINGQGTLASVANSWHNELHPSKAGFAKFAAVFHQRLKELFPNRVL